MRIAKSLVAVAVVVGLAATLAQAAERYQSGLQPGDAILAVFEPLNVTGKFAGEPHCLVCENGTSPVAMIFAREISEPLVKLIAGIDAATAKHSDRQMGSFVVFLKEQPDLQTKLQTLASKQSLKHTVLSIDNPKGPDGFKVAEDSDVTVVFYNDFLVKANHAFRKGELTDKSVESILSDVSKLFSKE